MKLTEAQINQIPALAKVKSQREIAAQLGCSVRTVQYWVNRWRKAGVKVHVKRGRPSLKLVIR